MLTEHALAPARDQTEQRWIDVRVPESEELRTLQDDWGLHELSIEDALRPGHPPKLERFDDHIFLIMHTDSATEQQTTVKLALFMFQHALITVARLDDPRLNRVLDRAVREISRRPRGTAGVFHMLLDGLTDQLGAEVESCEHALDDLENRLEERPDPSFGRAIISERRRILRLMQTVREQRDVARQLEAERPAYLPKRLRPYLRDVHEHLIRLVGRLESNRELLNGIRDAHMAASDHRLSQIMRVLTVISTIMMPLGLIAGIYGMNVAEIPGSTVGSGFWWIIGAMVLIAGAMLLWFRRLKWI